MSAPQLEIQLIAAIVAVACALPGVFWVLRRMAMTGDVISHTVLLGIVLAFSVVKDLASPFLIIAAALTGLLTDRLSRMIGLSSLIGIASALSRLSSDIVKVVATAHDRLTRRPHNIRNRDPQALAAVGTDGLHCDRRRRGLSDQDGGPRHPAGGGTTSRP